MPKRTLPLTRKVHIAILGCKQGESLKKFHQHCLESWTETSAANATLCNLARLSWGDGDERADWNPDRLVSLSGVRMSLCELLRSVVLGLETRRSEYESEQMELERLKEFEHVLDSLALPV
jgi:hypothetical protein